MKKNYKVLFLGRKNDRYSNQIYSFLKKKIKTVNVIWSGFYKEKKKSIFLNKKYDYILCFRSYYILSEKNISNAKFAAINFHPSTPKYRGFGCQNYAIYNNETFLGCTAHLMNKKIDNGPILDVSKFKVYSHQTLSELLDKTHQIQVLQVKKIVNSLLFKNENIEKIIKKSKKNKWGKKFGTKKKLDKFYEIKLGQSKKGIFNKLRSTILTSGNFRPYILYNKRKFFLNN